VGCLLTLGFVLLATWGSLYVIDKIRLLLAENLWPAFYDAEKRRRTARRRRFADHVESEIRRLNNLEQWSDYRFAELEAEVEAEGRRRLHFPLGFLGRARSTLRRETSLAKALAGSKERLVLVEGEPGAGKSVAFRHVVLQLSQKAMRSKNARTVIPVYVNLRELDRAANQAIDRNLINQFVLRTLNRFNDRDLEEFLEQEFALGLKEGAWFFLFDSFDEIPEILSSVGADRHIREYAQAISDFLGGMNCCRGAIASRQFRGPGQLGWPRFRVLTLSQDRQRELIRRADLGRSIESQFLTNLAGAPNEITAMANNPMFLGLLCEHARIGYQFPTNAHKVFETYLKTRLTRDAERLEKRFKLRPKQVREVAERIAFCMASDSKLGLNPSRTNLKASFVEHRFGLVADLDVSMDALEFIKLARPGPMEVAADTRTFTFAHRRFQEYFATCIVLNDFARVSPRELLTNGRWRETAVVLCQTQPLNRLNPILQELGNLLSAMTANVPIKNTEALLTALESGDQNVVNKNRKQPRLPFGWPPGSLHLLGIVQEGFGAHTQDLPEPIRENAGRLVAMASCTGILPDRKWALDVAGSVKPSMLLWLLRDGFSTSSQWLRDVAYRQVARLEEPPKDIAGCVRSTLVEMTAEGRISRDWSATRAHLSRLHKNLTLLPVARLLRSVRPIDLLLHFLYGLFILNIYHGQFRIALLYLCLEGLSLSMLFAQPKNWFLEVIFRNPISRDISKRDILMAAIIRSTLLLIPVSAAASRIKGHGHRAYLVAIMCSGLYASTWAPLALLAAKFGEFVSPWWWLLMPIWPVLYVSRSPVSRVKEVVAMLEEHRIFLTLQLTGVPVMIAIVKLMEKYRLFRWIGIGILIASFLVTFVWPTITYVWLLLLDRLQWQKSRKKHAASVAPEHIEAALNSFRTIRFKVRFLQAIYARGILLGTPNAEEKLVELLTEHFQREPSKREFAVAEELSKLLEQLRLRPEF
jgi:Cdc6-like AAA superfamily ATPase